MYGWSINSPILLGQIDIWKGITTQLAGETGMHLATLIFVICGAENSLIDANWPYTV